MNSPHLIVQERQRQIVEEGWSLQHDQQWVNGELAKAAICYLRDPHPNDPVPNDWPFDASWWKPKDTHRNLERAGALVIAERDRLGYCSVSEEVEE